MADHLDKTLLYACHLREFGNQLSKWDIQFYHISIFGEMDLKILKAKEIILRHKNSWFWSSEPSSPSFRNFVCKMSIIEQPCELSIISETMGAAGAFHQLFPTLPSEQNVGLCVLSPLGQGGSTWLPQIDCEWSWAYITLRQEHFIAGMCSPELFFYLEWPLDVGYSSSLGHTRSRAHLMTCNACVKLGRNTLPLFKPLRFRSCCCNTT